MIVTDNKLSRMLPKPNTDSTKKIKLGIVNTTHYTTSYGGIGPFIRNLDPFLRDAFDVTYINLPDHLHNIRFIPNRLVFSLFLLFKRKSLKKYDVIFSHLPEGSYIVSFINVPLVHIFHGNHNPMSQSRFWYGKYFKRVYNSLDKRIIKKAKLLYTVGNERDNIPKILNPIFHSVSVKPTEQRSGFIFAGRLEKIKNIDRIIKVYSLLPDEIIKNHALYIAGFGTQESFLKQVTTDLKISNRVIFTGDIPNDKLVQIVSEKKILLMASSQEGLPMAIAESLSVGVPVITTITGDIPRAVKDNFNGFLLPINFDDDKYIDRINQILNNYEVFAANALQSSEMFKAENVSHSLIENINRILISSSLGKK